jgi:5-methylcytosine-specific restriction endonuclease McrA
VTRICKVCNENKSVSEFAYSSGKVCKSCLAKKQLSYQRDRMATDLEFRKRQMLLTATWRKLHPEQRKTNDRNRRNANGQITRYQQHVLEWKRWRKIKHDAHVKAFLLFKDQASDQWHSDYWEKIKKPWLNPRLSEAEKYQSRYANDFAFCVAERTRSGWRRQVLKKLNDGTINYAVLINERKTCPYCGTKLTQDNIVIDHMDPITLGGQNTQSNLTACCRPCNQRKAGRAYVDWLDMLSDKRRSAALLWYVKKHKHKPQQPSLTFEFK